MKHIAIILFMIVLLLPSIAGAEQIEIIDSFTATQITNDRYPQINPDVNANFITWQDCQNGGLEEKNGDCKNWDISLYNTETHKIEIIASDPKANEYNPKVYGNSVVFLKDNDDPGQGYNINIYLYDFITKTTKRLTWTGVKPTDLVFEKNYIVYFGGGSVFLIDIGDFINVPCGEWFEYYPLNVSGAWHYNNSRVQCLGNRIVDNLESFPSWVKPDIGIYNDIITISKTDGNTLLYDTKTNNKIERPIHGTILNIEQNKIFYRDGTKIKVYDYRADLITDTGIDLNNYFSSIPPMSLLSNNVLVGIGPGIKIADLNSKKEHMITDSCSYSSVKFDGRTMVWQTPDQEDPNKLLKHYSDISMAKLRFKIITEEELQQINSKKTETMETETINSQISAGTEERVIGHWRFDGDTKDYSGNNNDGVLHGAKYDINGISGKSLNFDGTDDYLELPVNIMPYPNSGTGTSPFTVDFWFKTESGGVILGQQGGGQPSTAPSGHIPGIWVGTDGKLYANLFYWTTNNPIKSKSIVNDGDWHHAIVMYDGDSETLHLDGIVIDKRTDIVQNRYTSDYYYQIGTGYTTGIWTSFATPGGWFYFKGNIDEFKIYNYDLSRGNAEMPEEKAEYNITENSNIEEDKKEATNESIQESQKKGLNTGASEDESSNVKETQQKPSTESSEDDSLYGFIFVIILGWFVYSHFKGKEKIRKLEKTVEEIKSREKESEKIKICHNCGTKLEKYSTNFCKKCGTKLKK